jgi:flavin-dependent thymidylate synthase
MLVKLAGFNVDVENINTLNEILKKYPDITAEDIEILKKMYWTPETISASYARISRDPRPINELRKESREEIEKSRKSNKSIIFDMGHSSIAEHGVFNIDIIGISRLISEELEKNRLVSFTEKSQRYIKINDDILYPMEYEKDRDFNERYKSLTVELFQTYSFLLVKLEEHFKEKFPVENQKSAKYRDVLNLAKEDARYILPLSMLTQVGMTINSRNLEKVIRKLLALDISEARTLGGCLFDETQSYAPSLVKYTTPGDFEIKTYRELGSIFKEYIPSGNIIPEEVELIGYDPDMENRILSGLMLKLSAKDYNECCKTIENLSPVSKQKLLKESLKYLNSYESLPREFELPSLKYNILITASAFAQLKRHRLLTLIDGQYSPELGVKIPPSIIDIGLKDIFLENIDKINKLYSEAKEKFGISADYILSNSHRKNIYLKCNFRELVHITRLRSDSHAQWDIREISDKMKDEFTAVSPFLGNLLCGKDKFDDSISKFKSI